MDALSTQLRAKLAFKRRRLLPCPCRGPGFRTGSHGVPVGFRVVFACQSPIFLGWPGFPGRTGAGATWLEPCATSGPRRIPTEFRRSDVKVRAFRCLCAGVVERRQTPGVPRWPRRPRLHVFSTPQRDGPRPDPGTNVDSTRRKRGVPSLSIDQTTADVQAIQRLAASRPPGATASPPPVAGSDTERRSARRPGADP